MSNYELALTAAEIDIALQKAHNPDTSPQATNNLVTSGGVKTYVDNRLFAAYPIGSVYMNASNGTNPATLMGFGTWVAFGAGRVPVGIDATQTEFDTAEETGGAKNHTLTTAQLPSHRHVGGICDNSVLTMSFGSVSGYSQSSLQVDRENGTRNPYTNYVGGGQAHNNLQPYIVVYMWKRTA